MAQPQPIPLTYLVADNNIPTHVGVGGHKIIEQPDGTRIVRMTSNQAKWYLDNGAIKAK